MFMLEIKLLEHMELPKSVTINMIVMLIFIMLQGNKFACIKLRTYTNIFRQRLPRIC